MSTRSATIIKQTTYWGDSAETEEIMRFYRHCDGYPEGHGMQMANSIAAADSDTNKTPRYWLSTIMHYFLDMDYAQNIEFEPRGCKHGDLEYLYVVEGIVDYSPGVKHDGKLPVTISVYGIGCDEDYADAEKREPIFSGTAYEYIERFGKGQ